MGKAEDLATSACDKVTEKSSTAGSVCTSALDYIMEKADAKCTDTGTGTGTDTDTDTNTNTGTYTDTNTDTDTDTDTDCIHAMGEELVQEQSGASIDICSEINTKAGDLATQVCDKVTEKSSTLGSVCTSALDALMEKLDAKCTETVGEELVQEQSGASIDICSTINSKAEELATSACDKVTEKSSTLGSYCTSALDALMEKADAKCKETVGEELVQEQSGASIDICSTINSKAGDLATQVCDKVTEKSSTLGS